MIEFKGDFDVADEQKDKLRGVLRKEGFDDVTVTVKPVGLVGDNFASNVKRLTVENKEKKLSIVVKVAPTLEIIREMMTCNILFAHETIMYEEVLPKFVELQKSAEVPEIELFRYPKCYTSISQAPHELLALEDMSVVGMEMRDKLGTLTNEEVKSVLTLLATFHSLSLVLREKEPDFYENVKSRIVDTRRFMFEKPEFKMFLQNMESSMMSLIDKQQKELMEGVLLQGAQAYAKLVESDIKEKYSGLSHGDCWSNNILFKQKDDSVQSVLIDYQTMNIRSPAADVQYFIFAATDREARCKHYQEWLDFYYSEYEKSLSYFNMKASYYFPKEKFEVDLRRWAINNLTGLVMFIIMVLKDTADAISIADMTMEDVEAMMKDVGKFTAENMQTGVERMQKRIQDLIQCYIDYGYVKASY